MDTSLVWTLERIWRIVYLLFFITCWKTNIAKVHVFKNQKRGSLSKRNSARYAWLCWLEAVTLWTSWLCLTAWPTGISLLLVGGFNHLEKCYIVNGKDYPIYILRKITTVWNHQPVWDIANNDPYGFGNREITCISGHNDILVASLLDVQNVLYHAVPLCGTVGIMASQGLSKIINTSTINWRTTTDTVVTVVQRKQKLPSGKQPHKYGKSPFSMGKSTISMAIFNSKLSHYQRV